MNDQAKEWLRGGALFMVGALLSWAVMGGDDDAPVVDADDGTIWTCSMHPQIRRNEPGQCPICGMDLIPATTEDQAQLSADRIQLSERARTLAKIRTQAVSRHSGGGVDVRLLGRVDYDETRLRNVTAWTGGRIDRLHLRTTGERVRRGQVVAALYSPEVYAAHQDLIASVRQVARMRAASEPARLGAEAALDAARQRLFLLGVPEREVQRMEGATRPTRQVRIRSPFAGTVIERVATEGAYVQTGTVLYRVADLSKVWVQLEAYEQDLTSIAVGMSVSLEIEGVSEPVMGEVTFIDPTLDRARRVARVRVEVDNSTGALRPGVFAQATIESASESDQRPLMIPTSAALFTGRRSIVYVELPDQSRPTYEARVVRLGPRMGDSFPVVAGLADGERVVVHGAFALDADLQIRGGTSMMTQADDSMAGTFDDILEVSDATRRTLAPIVEAYLDMSEALADDAPDRARAAAAAIGAAVEAVQMDDAAHEAWSPLAHHLTTHAQQGVDAQSIEQLRAALEPLSAQVSALLRQFGNPLETPVRLAHCPMAFDNRGAEWLQRGEAVRNAYFGEMMLSCGEIRSTVPSAGYLGGSAPPPAPSARPMEHQH